MKYLYFMLLVLFLCSACVLDPPHVKAAQKIMNSFTKKMKKEGLILVGSGGSMMGDIQEINLDYETCQNVNVEQARMIFIKKTESLMYQINSDPEIRPYLHDYPFTSRNIFLEITFCKTDRDFVKPPNIAYVVLRTHKDLVSYSIYDDQTERLATVYEEPYEEALKIYNETISSRSTDLH